MTAVSYVIYLPGLRATVIEISSFFYFIEKMKNAYRISLYHGVYRSPFCVIIFVI